MTSEKLTSKEWWWETGRYVWIRSIEQGYGKTWEPDLLGRSQLKAFNILFNMNWEPCGHEQDLSKGMFHCRVIVWEPWGLFKSYTPQ